MTKLTLALAGASMWILSAGARSDNDCTGLGTTAAIALICSGACDLGQCESRGDGMDEKGSFSFCGCALGDYDNCCTVVLRDGRARPRGTCPPCGATGVCGLADNTPEGNLHEPECKAKIRAHDGVRR
jgi:hypothetical protein